MYFSKTCALYQMSANCQLRTAQCNNLKLAVTST